MGLHRQDAMLQPAGSVLPACCAHAMEQEVPPAE